MYMSMYVYKEKGRQSCTGSTAAAAYQQSGQIIKL